MRFIKLSTFTILSGIGWCIDFGVFNFLISQSMSYFASNLISATVAVTFVFITAHRWIFRNHVGGLWSVIGKYVLWNIVAIFAASFLLKQIATGLEGVDLSGALDLVRAITGISASIQTLISNAAKFLITPFTMYANFVAMGYIIERRFSFV